MDRSVVVIAGGEVDGARPAIRLRRSVLDCRMRWNCLHLHVVGWAGSENWDVPLRLLVVSAVCRRGGGDHTDWLFRCMYHVARLSTCLVHRNNHRAPHGCPCMLNIYRHSLFTFYWLAINIILRKIRWVNTPSTFLNDKSNQTFKKCWLQMTSTIFTLQNRKHMYIYKFVLKNCFHKIIY